MSAEAPRTTPPNSTLLADHPSLWLHGASLSGSTWQEMTRGLSRAQCPDLPGHGSAPMVTPPRVETYADTLLPQVPEGAVLIGHSLGGMVALELAARLGAQISALVLVESVPTVRDTLSGRISGRIAQAMVRGLPKAWLSGMSTVGQTPATQEELRRHFTAIGKDQLIAAMAAAAAYDGRRHLSTIAVPTLVVVGKKNSATHRGARIYASQIRGAQYVELSGGHMLHTDTPVELRETIDGFLDRALSDAPAP